MEEKIFERGIKQHYRLYWPVLGCIGLYWAVLDCNVLYLAVLGSNGLYWTVLGYTITSARSSDTFLKAITVYLFL